jgi:Rod binding domain-containing protein
MQITNQSVTPSSLDPQSLNRLNNIADKKEKVEAVVSQLETAFFSMMMKAMRATVPDGGLFGKGLGAKHYEEMLDQQFVEIAGMPRDPRFHDALVNQIARDPAKTHEKLSEISKNEANAQAAAAAGTLAQTISRSAIQRTEPNQAGEDQASSS